MLWQDWSPGFDGGDDVARAKDALRGPANLAAALGYYRAALGAAAPDAALADVQAATSQIPTQPTLYLHGTDDGAIGIEVADFAARGGRRPRRVRARARHRPLPPPRAAGRRERPHRGVPHLTGAPCRTSGQGEAEDVFELGDRRPPARRP